MTGYTYQGNGRSLSPAEAAATARRNGLTPAATAAKEAPVPASPPSMPVLKGAVKVERFPERSKYPFRQIADDGGVWRIDPAEFKVGPSAIKQAAPKWAQSHGLTVKCVEDDGMVYVQFTQGD